MQIFMSIKNFTELLSQKYLVGFFESRYDIPSYIFLFKEHFDLIPLIIFSYAINFLNKIKKTRLVFIVKFSS